MLPWRTLQDKTSYSLMALNGLKIMLSRPVLFQASKSLPRRYSMAVDCRGLIVPSTPDPPELKIIDIINLYAARVGAQSTFDPANHDRQHLMELLPKSQSELPARRMTDSYDAAIIPLSSDLQLREKYMTSHKTVRVGRLLEDLDVFAVWLCYKHILNPRQKPGLASPFCVVTALVDQIDFEGPPLRYDCDVRVRGHVTWVGKSSIETSMLMDQLRDGQWERVTSARFVLVARDPLNQGPAFVNPLNCETDEEKAVFQRGEENKNRRQKKQDNSLLRNPPSEEERFIIHEQFLKTVDLKKMTASRDKPPNTLYMGETELKNLIICQPEDRNVYNKIFGGFLMRQALELAWANSSVFSKSLPIFRHVDDILFRKPVEIGSLLYFSSQIVYTEGPYIMVRVSAEVVHAETGSRDLTNVFHFTLQANKDVCEIVPRSYRESMLYLDGRRHFLETAGFLEYSKL